MKSAILVLALCALTYAQNPSITIISQALSCRNAQGNPLTHGPTSLPDDCKRYYQCSNGILSIHDCGPGTVFNSAILVCDLEINVPDCSGNTAPTDPAPPVTNPTLPSKCTDTVQFDMMVVMDESGSIGTDNFEIAKNFTCEVVKSFQDGIDTGNIRTGVITFDSDHRTQIPMQQYSFADLHSQIMGLSYRRGGTLIGSAMEYATEQINIASPDPDRRKIMLVITDGNSADDPKDAADQAREDGILPLAVGVANYNINQLLDIVGNNTKLVFEVQDFGDLINYSQNISEVICTSDCENDPCLNGATCTDTADSFVCTCPLGFTGTFCSVVDNPCAINPCENGGVCRLTEDSYVCVCRNGFAGQNCTSETATCTASGDPHYRTFDGKSYDFQGTCEYVLARSLSTDMDEYFQVITENEYRNGNTRVSWLKRAAVYIIHPLYGEVHAILEREPQISVGLYDSLGNTIVLGDYHDDVGSIASGHGKIIIRFRGVTIRYDGFKIQVTIPDRYFAQVEGLCGNYNGHELDEFIGANNTILDVNDFGQSHIFGTCGDAPPAASDPCSTDQRTQWAAEHFCGAIISGNGTFSDCLSHLDLQQFANDCVFDLCATAGNTDTFSSYLTAVADFCTSEGHAPTCDWRQRFPNAPAVTCPANSHYEGCMSACPNTCLDPNAAASCPFPDVEGCKCDDGYVFHRGECIEATSCGCLSNQYGYVEQGFTKTSSDCSVTCSCIAPNFFQCNTAGCSPDEVCTQVSDDFQCQVPIPDPCASSPCQNGGICVSNVVDNTFTCRCTDMFTGATCNEVPLPPVTPPADDDCHHVPAIENGRHHWFHNEGNWPAEICRVQYECNDGFQLVGHRDIYCYKGHWSGEAPKCEVVRCQRLMAPENGKFEFVGAVPKYLMYSIAEFSCNPGHQISGDHDYVLICLPDGSWSTTIPSCERVTCYDDDAAAPEPEPSSPKSPVMPGSGSASVSLSAGSAPSRSPVAPSGSVSLSAGSVSAPSAPSLSPVAPVAPSLSAPSLSPQAPSGSASASGSGSASGSSKK